MLAVRAADPTDFLSELTKPRGRPALVGIVVVIEPTDCPLMENAALVASAETVTRSLYHVEIATVIPLSAVVSLELDRVTNCHFPLLRPYEYLIKTPSAPSSEVESISPNR